MDFVLLFILPVLAVSMLLTAGIHMAMGTKWPALVKILVGLGTLGAAFTGMLFGMTLIMAYSHESNVQAQAHAATRFQALSVTHILGAQDGDAFKDVMARETLPTARAKPNRSCDMTMVAVRALWDLQRRAELDEVLASELVAKASPLCELNVAIAVHERRMAQAVKERDFVDLLVLAGEAYFQWVQRVTGSASASTA